MGSKRTRIKDEPPNERSVDATRAFIAAVLAHFDLSKEWLRELLEPCVPLVIRAMGLLGRDIFVVSVISHMKPDVLSDLIGELRDSSDPGWHECADELARYVDRLDERGREVLAVTAEIADPDGRADKDVVEAVLAQYCLKEPWVRDLYESVVPLAVRALRLSGEGRTIANVNACISPPRLLELAGKLIRGGTHIEEGRRLREYVGSFGLSASRCLDRPEDLHLVSLRLDGSSAARLAA
jgi:hypothetical protein